MSSNRLTILSDTLVYSGSTLVVQGLNMVLAIYIRRLLGPEAMGVWALLQVYLTYISYFNLGIFGAVYREIPVLRGGGEEEKIRDLKNTAFSYVSLSSTLASLLLILGALAFREKVSDAIFYGLLTLSILNVLQRANNYQVRILITDKRFEFISRFNIYSAIVNAALTFLFVWAYHLYGLYLATLLSYVFNVFYLILMADLKFQFRWNKKEMKELVTFGVSLIGVGFVKKIFFSLDKIVIAKLLGLTELGYYSIAILAGNYIAVFPNMFHVVLFPRILEKFGTRQDPTGLKKYSTLPSQMISLFFLCVVGVCWIAGPYLCLRLLPDFKEGIPALKALIFGSCFMSLFEQMSTVLLGHKRHLWPVPVMFILGGVMVVLTYWLIFKGFGIFHVALVSSILYFLCYLICAFMALGPLYRFYQAAIEISKIIAPIGINLCLLLCLDVIWREVSLLIVIEKMLVYFLVLALPFLWFNRKFFVVELARRVFLEWVFRLRQKNPETTAPPLPLDGRGLGGG